MADYSAGSAYLTVLPDMSTFGAKVREELAKDNFDVEVKIKPDSSGAGSAEAAGAEYGGAFGEAARKGIEAALKDLPKATVDADSTPAQVKIAELRASLEELKDKKIGVDITAAEVLAKVAEIKASLEELAKDKKVDIGVRADAAAAFADLVAVNAEADKLDGKDVKLKVTDDGSANSSKNDINALMTAGIALGPAIVPVAAAVAAALAAIGTGAVIGVAAFGTVMLGIHGVSAAVSDLTAVQQNQAQDAQQKAAQQLSSANAVASAEDGVRNAVRGVDDAQRSATLANQQAAEQVANAERAKQDAVISAGISIQNALQSEVQARQTLDNAIYSETQSEQTLTNAQQQEQLSLDALTLARQTAQRQIESLTLAVEDGALAERQAQLNIQTAKQALDLVMTNPTATIIQRQQAQLTYDQAVQQLKDVQARNQNNAQDKAAADTKGVDGSLQVQAAQRGVTSATQAVASAQHGVASATQAVQNAQTALGTAQGNVDEARRKGAEQIMVAQQALTDAEAKQAETARAGAESVVKAQESVVAANRSLQGALSQQALQQATLSSSTQKLAQDMANLSPAGQQFAHFIHDDLSPKVKELQATAQTGLLPGVEAGIRAMFPVFPQIDGLIGTVSTTIGDMANRVGQALNDPFWREFISFINGEAAPSIRIFGQVMGNFATGGAAILEAFKPVWDQMGQGVLGLSQRFADFSKNLDQNKQFQDFLAYVKTEGPIVVSFLGDLIAALAHLGQSLGPVGGVVLSVVDAFVKFIAWIPTPVLQPLITVLYLAYLAYSALKIIDTVNNLIKDNTIITKASEVAQAVWNTAGAAGAYVMGAIRDSTLGATIATTAQTAASKIAAAAQWLWNAALDANPIGIVVIAIAALVVGVIYCYTHFQTFRDIVKDVWTVVRDIITAVWNYTIRVIFDAITGGLQSLNNWFHIFGDVVNVVWQGLKIIFDAMTGNWQGVVAAFNSGMNSLQDIWNRLINIAKVPVNFLIDVVYNHGIVPVWNDIAGLFGLGTLPPIALLAEGGVLPGYAPGRDTVPAMLSAGEGVLVPEAVRGLGAGFVHSANSHFSGGRANSRGTTHFAGGGIVGGIAGIIADPIGSIKSLFSNVTSAVIPGAGLLHQALVDIPGKVIDAIIAKAKNLVTSIGSAFSAAFTGSPDLAGWIAQAISLTGVPGTWAGPLSVLIGRESGGNPNAINLWDSNAAAGHPSQGLMQTIPGTFMAYHQAGTSFNILDPIANIAAGINYIKARYGDIFHVQQANPNLPPQGYDSGGWLPPGITVAYNGTGMAEKVLTAPQYQALSTAAQGGSTGPTINVYPRADHSEADIADMVERRLSFALRVTT